MPSRAWLLDVRRLAALDMAIHGPRLILIEFAAGVVGCAVLGALAFAHGIQLLPRGMAWQLVLGVVLLGMATNYVPLLLHAIDIASHSDPRVEAAYELARPEVARQYTARQLLLVVPLAVAVLALVQGWRRA